MSTVKECPFCGGADISDGEVLTKKSFRHLVTQSMCRSCGALGPEARLPEHDSVDYGDMRSIEAWNQRAVSPENQPCSVDIDQGDPFLLLLQTYGANFGKPMTEPHRVDLIANINAWGVQQREAGRKEMRENDSLAQEMRALAGEEVRLKMRVSQLNAENRVLNSLLEALI